MSPTMGDADWADADVRVQVPQFPGSVFTVPPVEIAAVIWMVSAPPGNPASLMFTLATGTATAAPGAAAAIEPNNALPMGIAPAPTLNVPDISPVCCSDPLPHGNRSFWLIPSGSGQRFVDDDALDVLMLLPVSVGLGVSTREKYPLVALSVAGLPCDTGVCE